MYTMFAFLKALSDPGRDFKLKAANVNPLAPQRFTFQEMTALHDIFVRNRALGKICAWHHYTSPDTSLITLTKEGDSRNNHIALIRKFDGGDKPYKYAASFKDDGLNFDTQNFDVFVKVLKNSLRALPVIAAPKISASSRQPH